jgi:glycosyltransferase involved in cell wall biosynthesis
MKNLMFALEALCHVTAQVHFSIYGPIDDDNYWRTCQSAITQLPGHISATYCGPISHESVSGTLAQHDLFFLPSRGENFGHVIFESLAAGTPVLVSDQTPWRADSAGALETLPITDPSPWLAAIERWSALSEAELAARRATAARYAREYLATSPALEQNRTLFRAAAGLGRANS